MEVLEKIAISSNYLDAEQIQELMIVAKRNNNPSVDCLDFWNIIIDKMWNDLEIGLPKTDDQLLCATCFFNIISITDKLDYYTLAVKKAIDEELLYQTKKDYDGTRTLHAVSLMYGIFQSSFLIQKNKENKALHEALNSTFKLLVKLAYEYTPHSFIAVKTISSFKKVLGTEYQNILLNGNNQIILLNLVNHNWENPITGIRDLIRVTFKTIISVANYAVYNSILIDIKNFYWNKAKYLMLSEIIEHSQEDISHLMGKSNWIDGLFNSLYKPGLVSAGADMYYAVLKKIYSEDEWCKLFLKNVVDLLSGSSIKGIENFNNYWCLTTLKKFPSIMNIILEEMENGDETEEKMYSIVYLMKQGNKLGILSKNWESSETYTNTEKLIIQSLEHYNTNIRMLAFDIICLTHAKSLPTRTEYDLIYDYIKNNINSDCTVLRLNMLMSLNNILSQLHILFRNIKEHSPTQIEDMEYFLKRLQEFVVWSLNLDGNYQRKIATVKVFITINTCLSEIPRKKKQQTRNIGQTLMEYLKDKHIWILHDEATINKLLSLLKDPSDDIRDNVLKLLLHYYSNEFDNDLTHYYSGLVEDALNSRKSKFFYDINCSQVMFKLISSLLVKKEHNNTIFKNVNDIFDYAFNELKTEFQMEKDVLKAIEDGKQLHSFISILHVVLETCLTNSYKIDISEENINNLLGILEGISDKFTWEQNSTSSDFSKMSDMIENIIAQSGCAKEESDATKLSSVHQIVLNSLWFNVKASCDLAALIIQYHLQDEQTCAKCLVIITNVLETSRHKGAIEAAGAALGKSIQYLTTLPEDSAVSQLPQTLLKSKLYILISEASKMASITRRGAGLSIMVHRIVSSDVRKGKPLFHYFMRTLLDTCANTENVPDTEDIVKIENLMDLPKAILIHFLTKIVTDSSLASDMMFYSADLAELAFTNLTSPHWQIRNAALQLYGALIPRLIGQKKASGTDEETIATVGYDEMRTHSPKLWTYITEHMKFEGKDDIVLHSHFVPTLNLLASVAMRYNFTFDLDDQVPHDDELLRSLFHILDSPIHTVRRLTAKCIVNIFPFDRIYMLLLKTNYTSENFLHGSLLVLKHCSHYYEKQGFLKELTNLTEMFSQMLKKIKHSYWSREVLESILESSNSYSEEDLVNIFSEVNAKHPGSFLWANTCVKNCILYSDWNNITNILNILLKQNDYELYCEFLLNKIEAQQDIPVEDLSKIANTLLLFENKFNSTIIWKILYTLSQKMNFCNVDVSALFIESKVDENNYKLRYLIPFIATQFLRIDEMSQKTFQSIVFKMSDFEYSDVDMRYIAVLANNEIANVLHKLSEEAKVSSIKTAILLLQDEDEDIRNIAVGYYKKVKRLKIAVHPYICLNKMLSKDFLEETFINSTAIQDLCESLNSLITRCNISDTDNYNPFANDSKNIYIETNVLSQTLIKLG